MTREGRTIYSSIAKTVILLGCILILVGIGMLLLNRLPFLGRLPGDIVWKKGNFTLIMPLTTSILISLVLTLVLNLLLKR